MTFKDNFCFGSILGDQTVSGGINGVTFNNINSPNSSGSSIANEILLNCWLGKDDTPIKWVENIFFNNVSIEGEIVSSSDDAHIKVNEKVRNLHFNVRPAFTTALLMNGVSGKAYNQQIAVSGGSAPCSFLLLDGALLSGITLSKEGLLSGTPTEYGEFPFLLKVIDANNQYVDGEFKLILDKNIVSTVAKSTLPKCEDHRIKQHKCYCKQCKNRRKAPDNSSGFCIIRFNFDSHIPKDKIA